MHRQSRSPHASRLQGAPISPPGSEGMDSPTYDGDVESSATGVPLPSVRSVQPHHQSSLSLSTTADDSASNETPPSPITHTPKAASLGKELNGEVSSPSQADSPSGEPTKPLPASIIKDEPSFTDFASEENNPRLTQSLAPGEPAPPPVFNDSLNPALLTPDDIRGHVQAAIDGTRQPPRKYRPNPPPLNRSVRVYADGVYDIFHFGHALQLRQAKLSFESVHLLVGVCSDELCSEHKSRTVMNHAERCESVRHCRWVDEIIPDAPWIIDQTFLDKHNIDFVAHDDDPYQGSDGSEDVYEYVKSIGRFIPTRRTPGVSTSELLERIVAGYKEGDWDAKLVKIGHPELASRAPSRSASRPQSRLSGKATTTLSPAPPSPSIEHISISRDV
ncbi:hypothetical protein FRC01_007618 [Tulasnella sp. 417]|nr:hypothetical protein FRC01_007618 [Tulasnella sp. 417]